MALSHWNKVWWEGGWWQPFLVGKGTVLKSGQGDHFCDHCMGYLMCDEVRPYLSRNW